MKKRRVWPIVVLLVVCAYFAGSIGFNLILEAPYIDTFGVLSDAEFPQVHLNIPESKYEPTEPFDYDVLIGEDNYSSSASIVAGAEQLYEELGIQYYQFDNFYEYGEIPATTDVELAAYIDDLINALLDEKPHAVVNVGYVNAETKANADYDDFCSAGDKWYIGDVAKDYFDASWIQAFEAFCDYYLYNNDNWDISYEQLAIEDMLAVYRGDLPNYEKTYGVAEQAEDTPMTSTGKILMAVGIVLVIIAIVLLILIPIIVIRHKKRVHEETILNTRLDDVYTDRNNDGIHDDPLLEKYLSDEDEE